MFKRVPKEIVIVGPVAKIAKSLPKQLATIPLDPKVQPCVPSYEMPHALFFESIDAGKRTLAMYADYMVAGEGRDRRALPEFPSKFDGRRCIAAVASTCRNAVLFFPVGTAPPLVHQANLILHLKCSLLDESVLGAGCRLGAYLWPVVRALSLPITVSSHGTDGDDEEKQLVPAQSLALRKDGLPSRALPCYVVTEWHTMLPPPSAFFGSVFTFTEKSVLDEFDIVVNTQSPLPAWKHGFRGRSCIQVSHTDMYTTTSIALGVIPTDKSEDLSVQVQLFHANFKQSNESVIAAFVQHQAQLDADHVARLWTMQIRGPFANIRIYASMLVRSLLILKSYDRGPLGHADWASLVLRDITIWLLSDFITEHPEFRACVATRPSLLSEIKQLAVLFVVNDEDGSTEYLQPYPFWKEFIEDKSLAYILFPWRNKFVIPRLSLALHGIIVDVLTEFLDLAPTDTLKELGIESVSNLRCHPNFEYQRLAMKFYIEKLLDRNRLQERSKGPVSECVERNIILDKIARGGADPDDIIQDNNDITTPESLVTGTPCSGGVGGGTNKNNNNNNNNSTFSKATTVVRDDSFYAMKGAHGNGHVHVMIDPTSSPFDADTGGFIAWLRTQSAYILKERRIIDETPSPRRPEAITKSTLASHSPIILDEDATGGLRVAAVTDVAAMMYIAWRFRWARDEMPETQRIPASGFNPTITNDVMLPTGKKVSLSEEQMAVIRHMATQWLTMPIGGGGTGKSLLIAAFVSLYAGNALALFHERDGEAEGDLYRYLMTTNVVVLMAYGTPASNFSRKYGIPATTVHLASALLNCNFWNDDRQILKSSRGLRGGDEVPEARVVICDEFYVTSLDHVVMLLNAFPRAMRFIFVGDKNQMRSIDRGNIGEIMLERYSAVPGIVATLTHNFRLTQTKNNLCLGERTHSVFDAILGGALIGNKKAYGPYDPVADPATLPGMVAFDSWQDTTLIQKALTTCPILNLPHDQLARGADVSLRETCDRLIDVIGSTPKEWEHVQIITQRHEEVRAIADHITRRLFPQIPVHPQFNSLPAYDLYVGERVMFRMKMAAFTAEGAKLTIHKNGIRVIAKVTDVDEVTVTSEKTNARGEKTKISKSAFINPKPRRSTQEYVHMPAVVKSRRRVITFTDGSYVVCRYVNKSSNKEIRFLARGLCATNSSMQGLSEKLVVLFIRPAVSHTFDRNEAYTALTRMEENAIVISTPVMMEKVVKQDPPVRNNPFADYLVSAMSPTDDVPLIFVPDLSDKYISISSDSDVNSDSDSESGSDSDSDSDSDSNSDSDSSSGDDSSSEESK